MNVIPYNLERTYRSISDKLPGHPIFFFKCEDTLLDVQDTIMGTSERPHQVLISSFEPQTLEIQNWQKPIYGFQSNFTIIHPIPRILTHPNNSSWFYMPIIRDDISSHIDTVTIFRKVNDLLILEYIFNLTGFDRTLNFRPKTY
ncbi:hypothetical protein ACFOUP_06635 [Belliella kenyensis]|uniref:Uncharacterized protein n=2 Tax=Belliella kenyensis TaxID=1472724 RepID=A0ABV8ELG4_9BACT|nr:hypothetical protein [Belliella kenyensis]MCH7401262.1 hypothetical protein [Belliella kenyensis]